MAAGYKTGGRTKGSLNKHTADVKAMILGALSDVGGRDYLAQQATQNPSAFMTLVGKVLPMQIAGDPDRPIAIDFSWAAATPQQVADATTEAVGQVLEVAWTENSEDT